MYRLIRMKFSTVPLKIFPILIFINLLLITNLYSQKNTNSELQSIKDSIEKYYYNWNIAKFNEINDITNDFINRNPNIWYGYYYSGMINLCLGKIHYTTNEKKAFDHFDEAVEKFYKAVELNSNAENLALLSASYGKKSSLSGINAIFWGIKSKNRILEAFNKDSNNVTVLLTAATHLMHTPAIYGGDKKKAMQLLNKALKLNSKNLTNDKFLIDWAKDAEIYAYIAQIHILENNFELAENYMKKALAIVPDYDFVLIDLRKQIQKAKK